MAPSWRSVRTKRPTARPTRYPKRSVQGRDLLNAAKDGYVYRAKGKGKVTLLKRDKDLVLKIRPAFVNSPEMAEVARIFHLKPGLEIVQDQVRADRGGQSTKNASDNHEGNDTIYMNLRSVLQIMTFLSKGVCVPEDHVISGVAPDDARCRRPAVRLDAGDGRQLPRARAEAPAPRIAEVAVHYRGYWFYIASDDVKSRAVAGDPRDLVRASGVG